MQLPPLQPETAHLGCWISRKAVYDLVQPMAIHYWRRFKSLTISGADDLAQSATLALLQYEADNGQIDRIRELTAIGMLHRAMVADVRSNRKESIGGGLLETPDRHQLSDKQVEMLSLWTNIAAKAARKPMWECLWLRKVVGWSEDAISRYFSRKKDERQYISPEQVGKYVRLAAQRIKKRMPPDLNVDLRLLALYP